MQEVRYDEKTGRALLASARRCFANAGSTLNDAALLFSEDRYDRSYALSVLAQEEFSKGFLLCNCAAQNRWDEPVYESLVHHEKKQALVHVMLQYVNWLETKNRFAFAINASALIPSPITSMPSPSEFQQWVAVANRQVIQGRRIDRSKQRALYVSINKDGVVSSFPSTTRQEAESELDRAQKFQRVAEIQCQQHG